MEELEIRNVLEALLFITNRPLSPRELLELLEDSGLGEKQLREHLQAIAEDYRERGSALQVLEVAGGFQMASRSPYAPWIRRLYKDETTTRLSTSALETLSIVAYKQPITRAEIEEIRGVEVIAVLETLLERRLVKVLGRRETVGRPLVYGTTPEFLRQFGLKALTDLPALPDAPLAEKSEPTALAGGSRGSEEPGAA